METDNDVHPRSNCTALGVATILRETGALRTLHSSCRFDVPFFRFEPLPLVLDYATFNL